jgi:Ser/Thr protein kinase RdoA (MazF antagonist)
VAAVQQALADLQAHAPALTGLPEVQAAHADAALTTNWADVATNPTEFLRLRLCSEAWLKRALPSLAEAAAEAPLAGEDVLHLDVRSDNLCFRGAQAVLVDWNHVCLGNRKLDIAFWLPSLHSEGGPEPEMVVSLEAEWPAVVSGYFAARAGLPPIPQAPTVRGVQLRQLRAALPWAVRALGLQPLDGPNAPAP